VPVCNELCDFVPSRYWSASSSSFAHVLIARVRQELPQIAFAHTPVARESDRAEERNLASHLTSQ
jgi:hypothetical protein